MLTGHERHRGPRHRVSFGRVVLVTGIVLGALLPTCSVEAGPSTGGEGDPPGPEASAAAHEALCIIGPGMRLHRFEVEIADDARERARGLMFRRHLAPARGMLFWFPAERPVSMWMKNTFVPLDMLFIDVHGVVVSLALHTEPGSERTIPSGGPVTAVLELNAGEVEENGIAVGDQVLHRYFGRSCP